MTSERPLFDEDEYVVLTQKYQDIPVLSVGTIAKIYTTHPPCYLVSFGPFLSRGPIPEKQLTRLSGRHDRKHP